MSEYLKSLDSVAKERYIKRLSTIGSMKRITPMLQTTHKFVENLALWHPSNKRRINLYTARTDAVEESGWYNCFQSGFVHEVKLWALI